MTSAVLAVLSRLLDGLPHVLEKIGDHLLTLDETFTKAARTSQVQWLQTLLGKLGCRISIKQIEAAASGGHLDAVELIVSQYHDKQKAIWEVLMAAAKFGHIQLVEFALRRAVPKSFWGSNALIPAVSGGREEVVKLLLSQKTGFRWDIAAAVDEAVRKERHAMVESIRNLYPQYLATIPAGMEEVSSDLLILMVRRGFPRPVKYLLEKKMYLPESLGDAFVAATTGTRSEIVESLSDAGNIPLQSREIRLVNAAKSGVVDIVEFLYSKYQFSALTLNQAFVSSTNSGISTFLYDTGSISSDSLAVVFRARLFRSYSKYDRAVEIVEALIAHTKLPIELITQICMDAVSRNDSALVNVLYRAQCFSSEATKKLFLTAVGKNYVEVVQILIQANCLTDETIAKAFLTASSRGHVQIVECLVSKRRPSSGVITNGFLTAVKRGHTPVVKCLYDKQQASTSKIGASFQHAAQLCHFPVLRLMMNSPGVSREMTTDALINAARLGETGAIKFMATGSWSSGAVKRALEVAKDDKIAEFLRKKCRYL